MRRAQKGIRLSYIVACSTIIVYHLTLRSYSHSTPRPPPVSSSPASPITVSHSRFGSLQLYVDDRSPRRLAIAYRALQLVPMSFTNYAAQTETAPHLQFPLFHPAPSGLENMMPFPPRDEVMRGALTPPSFTISDDDRTLTPPSPTMDLSDEELDLQPALKKYKPTKPAGDMDKKVQFHPMKVVTMVPYLEGPKLWKLVPIKQRADEDGILYPKYWGTLAYRKKLKAHVLRRYVKQGCKCKKDDDGKDDVCFYCSRVHQMVMLKTHQRDEDDLGMKLDIKKCSALLCALDLQGMPPAKPMHKRKSMRPFFS